MSIFLFLDSIRLIQVGECHIEYIYTSIKKNTMELF